MLKTRVIQNEPTRAGRSPSIIEIDGLTKNFGSVRAVDRLSFSVTAGTITGFLGANGSGKTTTLRALLGLVAPTEGSCLIDGHRYRDLRRPLSTVGSVLEATTHPARTARNHLAMLAAEAGVPRSRVGSLLELVDLHAAADRRVGGFSLGMRQRLGLAGALMGDPAVLVLDEPANGLDPEGIRWLREFLRRYAARGRTVLVSSHNLAEVEQTVDDVVIIAQGLLRAHCTLEALRTRSGATVEVRTSHVAELRGRLAALQIEAAQTADDRLLISGAEPETVGEVAALGAIPVFGMTTRASDLESLFFELTATSAGVLA